MSKEKFKSILLIFLMFPFLLFLILFGYKGIKQPEIFKSDKHYYNVKQESYSDSIKLYNLNSEATK